MRTNKLIILCGNCKCTPLLTFSDEDSTVFSECKNCLKKLSDSKFSKKNMLFEENLQAEKDYLCPGHSESNDSNENNEYINRYYYIWYCTKCDKNFCNDCYKHHKKHKENLIYFGDERIEEEELEEIKKRRGHMMDCQTRLFKLKKHYQELILLINEFKEEVENIFTKINELYIKFTEKYIFNFEIVESYNLRRINYNSILNIKKFKYTKNELYDFYVKNSIGKIKNKIIKKFEEIKSKIDENFYKDETISILISQLYPIENILKEIITYQYNEMQKIEYDKKKSINIIKTGDLINIDHNSANSKIKTNLSYKFESSDKILGKIDYIQSEKKLIISVNNENENYDLLFITSNDCPQMTELNNLLNTIALSRNKKIEIKRYNKIWSFEKDIKHKFIKWKEEIDLINKSKSIIDFIIYDISPEEWYQEKIKYIRE